MTEREPHEAAIDDLLRRSMTAPVPSLPPNFDQRLMGELRRGSQMFGRYRIILLTGYGLISGVTSAMVMRGQGLGWTTTAAAILGPLSLLAAVPWARRAFHSTMRHNAR